MSMDRVYESFMEKAGNIVGKEQISHDNGRLDSYRAAGPLSGGDPCGVVTPLSGEQVKELILLARSEGINLVFSSSSTPRFRGGTVPCGKGIIVDMSGLNKIVRIDRRNKVALIEPGVTFPDLSAAVEAAGMRALMPLLPRSGKSVLASYLEREPILIPKYHWDMTDPLLCTELIFGTGDRFRTGSAAGPGSLEQQWAAGGAQKNPMGPAQTDFARLVQGSQGTMAAVTWASVKLEVKPSVHRFYFVPADNLAQLVNFAYRALRPKLADEFFILNSYALASVISPDAEEIDNLAARQTPYTLVYGVAGYEHLPAQRVAYQEKDLSRIAADNDTQITRELPGCSADRMSSIVGGCSNEDYFKMNPRGAFRDIFFLTTLDRVEYFTEVVEEVAGKFDYSREQLGVYVQPIQHGRSAHVEFSFYFNPGDDEETEKIEKVYEEVSKAVFKAGAFFSRPYGMWADLAYSPCPDTVGTLKKIKNMLDPDYILNRGKLCFGEVE